MNSRYLLFAPFLFCILFIFNVQESLASHIYGAEINYTCVDAANNEYFVVLKLYRDCAAIPMPSNANVTLSSSSCSMTMNESLPLLSTMESSPYCDTALANTNCNGGSLPGFEVGYFGKVIVLASGCSDWVISHDQCCRNAGITNLVSPSVNSLFVKNEFNSAAAACNSSPQWKQPAVLFCGTGMVNLELGAEDPDGDSLTYTLVDAMNGSGNPIPYSIGYSATNPISTSTGIVFDAATGNMTFSPTGIQASVIAVRCDEYRNGALIASSWRDVQITIGPGTACVNPNYPPILTTGPTNVTGGTLNNGVVEVCAGSALSFNMQISAATVFGSVTLESNAADLGGTFGTTFLGTTFTWTPMLADTGVHQLIVSARGDCASPGISIFNFFIRVDSCGSSGPGPVDAGLDQNICLGGSAQLNATGGQGTGYQWTPTTGLSDPNIPNPIASPSTTTTYTVASVGGGMVLSTDSVTVFVNGGTVDIMVVSGQTNLCPDDTIVLTASATGAGFFGYNWSTGQTTSTISIHTFNPVTFSNAVSVTVIDNIGCSASDTIQLDLQDDCVWPGDANYDGIANNFDVLEIGIGFGATGPSRTGATINWESQWAGNWVDTFASGANYKHGDCNGDGTIDLSDTVAISQNYGLTHSKGSGANGNGLTDPALYFTFSDDSVNAGDTLIIYANLGRDTLPAANVYGVAFTVNYDASLVDTGSARTDFTNSWIDIPLDGLLSYTRKFADAGTIDIAITRTDQMNANTNFGPIGAISVVMKDDISGKSGLAKAFGVSYSHVKAVDATGTEIIVFREDGTAIVTQEAVGIDEPVLSDEALSVFPNPAKSQFSVYADGAEIHQIEIINLIGASVLVLQEVNAPQATVHSNLEPGVFLMRVETNKGTAVRKLIIVN